MKKTMWGDPAAISLFDGSEVKVYLLKIKYATVTVLRRTRFHSSQGFILTCKEAEGCLLSA